MFVGAINATVRKFLAHTAKAFDRKVVVVGCSGNFTSESVISAYAKPAAIHSNDISFYSCMIGRWLTHQPLAFELADPEYEWLTPYLEDDTKALAAVMVLLDMLEFEKRNNAHRLRMWQLYLDSFGELVNQTMARLATADAQIKLASFYEGDVFEHFKRFDDDAIFCCYAPTYAGGYERLYKRLDRIVKWDEPGYELLDDERRDQLLAWMSARPFLWYDDRLIDGMEPVMQQRSGIHKTVYLYSNVIETPAYFTDKKISDLPSLPLAKSSFTIQPDSKIKVARITTTDLAKFKDAFLSKEIDFASGLWAFAVLIDGCGVGFLEFARSKYQHGEAYMMADFAVPGTRYKRLSKLMVMLARAGETRKALERVIQTRTRSFSTTAFTSRPVSMKYRGVLNLVKRGEDDKGQKFLNYEAEFNMLTWQETLQEWLSKHSSKVWSNN